MKKLIADDFEYPALLETNSISFESNEIKEIEVKSFIRYIYNISDIIFQYLQPNEFNKT